MQKVFFHVMHYISHTECSYLTSAQGGVSLTILYWIILVIFLIWLWLTLDYHFGRKHHLKTSKDEVLLSEKHGEIQLITDGTELMNNLFNDIQHATQYIHIQFYIVKNDDISKRFLLLLKKKAEEGVHIRLLIDWIGSKGFPQSEIEQLKNAGVKFSFNHVPKLPFLFFSLQQRNHRKISIVDGQIAYLGGFNIGNEYINKDGKLSPWRDYHVKLKGESAKDIDKIFRSDWKRASGEDIQFSYSVPTLKLAGQSLHQIVPSEGVELEELYLSLINRATNKIYIASPYFIPTKKLMDALLSSLKRNVEIHIIVPGLSDHVLIQEASYTFLRQILSGGGKVHQFQNGFFHGKYIIIDNQVFDIGTANFDRRSLFLNYEVNCFIYDSAVIEAASKEIEQDIKQSKSIVLKDLQNLGLWVKIKEIVASTIVNFL